MIQRVIRFDPIGVRKCSARRPRSGRPTTELGLQPEGLGVLGVQLASPVPGRPVPRCSAADDRAPPASDTARRRSAPATRGKSGAAAPVGRIVQQHAAFRVTTAERRPVAVGDLDRAQASQLQMSLPAVPRRDGSLKWTRIDLTTSLPGFGKQIDLLETGSAVDQHLARVIVARSWPASPHCDLDFGDGRRPRRDLIEGQWGARGRFGVGRPRRSLRGGTPKGGEGLNRLDRRATTGSGGGGRVGRSRGRRGGASAFGRRSAG